MSKKALVLALCLVIFGMTATARASEITLLTLQRCQDYLEASAEDQAALIYYVDGYLTSKSDSDDTSSAWLRKLQGYLGNYCKKTKEANIATVIDSMSEEDWAMPDGENINMLNLPCNAFTEDMDDIVKQQISFWLFGYAGLPATDDPQHVSIIQKFFKDMHGFCGKNPAAPVGNFIKNQ